MSPRPSKPASESTGPATRILVAAGLSLSLLLAPSVGQAEPSAADKETARQLIRNGNEWFAAADYERALADYRDADAIMGVPTTGLGVVRALRELGRFVEARDMALAVSRLPVNPGESRPFAVARQEATKIAEELEPRIATLSVVIVGVPEGADTALWIDEQPVRGAVGIPRRLDPGAHIIEARARGFVASERVVLGEGEVASVTLAVEEREDGDEAGLGLAPMAAPLGEAPDTTAPDDILVPLAITGFALGGASLVVATATGIASLSLASSVDEDCVGNLCPSSREGDADKAAALAHASTATFVIAGVGVATGLTALLWPQDEHEVSGSVSPFVGVGVLGLEGRF